MSMLRVYSSSSSSKCGMRQLMPRQACNCNCSLWCRLPSRSSSSLASSSTSQPLAGVDCLRPRQQQQHLCSQWQDSDQQLRRRRGYYTVAASSNGLWTPASDAALASAAERLRGLVDALPELPDEVQGALAVRVPGLLELPGSEVRERLVTLSEAMQLDLVTTGRLIGKVPLLWNRSHEAATAKLAGISKELGIDAPAAAALLMSQPTLASVNMPGVVRDKVDAVSDVLGVSIAQAAQMLGRQSMLWVISRGDVRSPVPTVSSSLGLKTHEATGLVEKMPVLLACEQQWLQLNVAEVSASTGLPKDSLLDLLAKAPSLTSLSSASLVSAFEELAGTLEVTMSDVLIVVTQQPTLLLAKPAAVLGAMDVLVSSLRLPSQSAALQLLVQQPFLLYDITVASIVARLEQLSVVLACDAEQAMEAALRQPVLLVVPASTLQSALSSASHQLGRSSSDLMPLLLSDPGALLSLGYMGGAQGAASSWATRLGLDEQAVTVLVATQPALLEMSPNTLRARLEFLAALFDVPSAAAAQLILKHPALAAIPPNVTITRAKGMSTALRCSMARAGELIARVPALLVLPNTSLQPGIVAGTPVDIILDICATYEFYTTQWLMAAAKDRQPQRMTSFSGLHS